MKKLIVSTLMFLGLLAVMPNPAQAQITYPWYLGGYTPACHIDGLGDGFCEVAVGVPTANNAEWIDWYVGTWMINPLGDEEAYGPSIDYWNRHGTPTTPLCYDYNPASRMDGWHDLGEDVRIGGNVILYNSIVFYWHYDYPNSYEPQQFQGQVYTELDTGTEEQYYWAAITDCIGVNFGVTWWYLQ